MISIFTPTNDSSFLIMIYDCLLKQTEQDWEWIIVYNNGANPIGFTDVRIKEFNVKSFPSWVGPLKAYACEQASGEILLELDHDDLLLPEALEEVKRAFNNENVGFVYSNTIHSTGDFNKTERFNPIFGWKYREINYNGHNLDEHISFPPSPESISRIWFAPNHLRAFRRSVYEQVGGYSREMRILDDLDLICRMYLVTEFKHINKGLYIYRITGENTWLKYNQEIQENVYRIYDQYIEALAEHWADLNYFDKFELGGRIGKKKGFISIDLQDADIIADLNEKWPLNTSSVGVIRAYDIFEHLKNPIHVMKELQRVLVPGGFAFIQIPSTDGRGAFQDPTHVSFWNENSFHYYTKQNKAKYINTPVRFQSLRLYTTEKDAEQVCWVVAHLLNLKDGYRPCGLIEI